MSKWLVLASSKFLVKRSDCYRVEQPAKNLNCYMGAMCFTHSDGHDSSDALNTTDLSDSS